MTSLYNLELVGTSHISPESKKRIIFAFNKIKPEIICLEIDAQRLAILKDPNKKKIGLSAIKQIGITGYLFAIIGGYIQKKLGSMTGMMPGEEMLLGATIAQKNKIKLELIDQDVRITLRKINKIPFKEKFKIFLDFVKAPFQKNNKIKINLAEIPDAELVEKLTEQIRTRYPYIYKIIIEERNKHMAKRLFILRKNNPDKQILAIVGEGHIKGMKYELKKLEENNITTIKNAVGN